MSGPSASDRGLSGDRTALAWTRSALSLAVNGGLVVRAAFTSGLPVLGVGLAVAIGPATLLVWRQGERIALRSRCPEHGMHPQTSFLNALTALTICTAIIAAVLTIFA